MAASKTSDRMSYGITILIIGLLFLLQKLGVLAYIPYGEKLVSIGFLFLVAAIVFLSTQPKKVLGWIFLVIAILLNANLFFGWINAYSYLLVPAGLIVAGLAMVLTAKK